MKQPHIFCTFIVLAILSHTGHAAITSYRNLILSDNPVVYYELDETSGTNAVNSATTGGAMDMDTFVGSGITHNQPSAQPFLGTAYSFDGSSHIEAAPIPNSLPEWTFEAWINYGSGRNSSSTILTNDQGGWNDDVLIGIGPDGSFGPGAGNFGISQQGNPGSTRDTPGAALAGDEWHYVAITGSESSGRIDVYIDALLVASDTELVNGATFNGADGFGSAATLGLGVFRAGTTSQRYLGLVDEVALYGSVLTPTQLNKHFNNLPIPEPSTAILAGLGLAGICLRRRHRK